jgi:dihydroorotate dehydrogenase (NAD+) catalytic subunit
LSIVLSSGKRELILSSPVMNSAGILGFAGEARQLLDLDSLGAFVTAPVSLRPRTPAHGPRSLDLPAGLLLHTGLPNPGLRSVLAHEGPAWDQLSAALVLHLLLDDPQELAEAGRLMEETQRIDGFELGLEIVSGEHATAMVQAASRTQLPCILRLPLDCPDEVFLAAAAAGAHAIALGPPRGRCFLPDGGFTSGRVYGPALLPLLLEKLTRLRPELGCLLIAGAGLFTRSAVEAALASGADAVQLDTVLWTHPEIITALDEPDLHPGRTTAHP